MIARSIMLTLASAIVGGVIAGLVISQTGRIPLSKSDRLSGPTTETAFMPERFGVPATATR